jgi:hypothetical protein
MHPISIYRRYRSSWFGFEHHRHPTDPYFKVWWGHPHKHAWWACMVYLHY